MNYGYVKVAAAIPGVRVADCQYNALQIIQQMKEADSKGVEIIIFPELSITAYTCGDLFSQQLLMSAYRKRRGCLYVFSPQINFRRS